jgi:hypothetical protein
MATRREHRRTAPHGGEITQGDRIADYATGCKAVAVRHNSYSRAAGPPAERHCHAEKRPLTSLCASCGDEFHPWLARIFHRAACLDRFGDLVTDHG